MAHLDIKRAPLVGVEDLVMLATLSDKNIMENIKTRFAKDLIYTNIGQVLISVNPFKKIPGIYSDEQIQYFRTHGKTATTPHIFALAEDTYRTMVLEEENQCVIISGESGAGKTEASKQIMQYVAAVSGNSKEMQRVKEIMLESNPLLESFGNAKTVRNDNSSRFGKFFEIYFNRVGGPVGGKMSNFLLEKSRVVSQQEGERNFHIFYQFCCGADNATRTKYRLKSPGEFKYLNCGRTLERAGVSDSEEWKETKIAMDAIGINPDDQESINVFLAAILHLGEIEFKTKGPDADDCDVINMEALQFVAELLGIEHETLASAILVKRLEIGGEVVNVAQDIQMCRNTRDAIAKVMYDKLFNFIVEAVNIAFGKHEYALMLGVLDIYGFEIFKKNGFEQFCINYVNEKLQQIFIELTLKVEQEEYVREKIPWEEIKYFNNQIVCDLVEGKNPPGLFSIFDDVCAAMAKEKESVADIKMLDKLDGVHCGHPHFKRSDRGFMIKHYAGDVHYESAGFVNRNKDTLNNDVLIALATAKNRFFSSLLGEVLNDALNSDPSGGGSMKRKVTAGARIRSQAADLVATLKKCNPHYVRTIKSNDDKQPNFIDDARVAHQCKYLGLLENIRVRRAGYSYRQYFDKFLKRFKYTCSATFPRPFKGSDKQACEAIMMNALRSVPRECWQLGETKIFVRNPQNIFALEDLREATFGTIVSKVQRAWHRYRNNREYILLKANNDRMYSKAGKQRRADSVFRPFQGDYLKYRSELTQLHPLVDFDPVADAWKEYWGDGGKKYYYNFLSQVTVWDRPHEMDKQQRVFFSDKVDRIADHAKAGLDNEYMIVSERAIYFIQMVYETIVTPPTKPTKQNPRPPPPPAPYQIVKYVLKKRLDIRLLSGVSVSALADSVCVVHFYQGPVPYRPIPATPVKGIKECQYCCEKLTPAAKKGNCPGCGIVVCHKNCLVHTRPLPTLGYPKPVKVCPRCVEGEPWEAQEDIIISSPMKSEIIAMIRKVYKQVMGSRIPLNVADTIQYQLAFEPKPRTISFQLNAGIPQTQITPGLMVYAPLGIPQEKIAAIEVQREERRKLAQERYRKEQEEQKAKEIQREKEREEQHRKMVEERKRARKEADEKAERDREERERHALERRNASAKAVASRSGR